MKFILRHRFLAAAFFLSLLTPSVSHSQDRAQMDSMYATMQRAVLQDYPTALFPPIPHDRYEAVTISNEDGTVDVVTRLLKDWYAEYNLLFPEFTRWDTQSEESLSDPTNGTYVFVSFYVLDPSSGKLQQGFGSSTLLHSEKKRNSSPDQYEREYPDEAVVWESYPADVESYQCEQFLKGIPGEHPLHAFIKKHCPKE